MADKKTKFDPISMRIDIDLHDSPETAPSYGHPIRPLRLVRAVAVNKGTASGAPTVDLILADEAGNEFVTMTSAALLSTLVGAIAGLVARGAGAASHGKPS